RSSPSAVSCGRTGSARHEASLAMPTSGDAGLPARPSAPPTDNARMHPSRVKIVVGHLYPDYLNIYADRGNIAVLSRRAAWRGHELEVHAVSVGDPLRPGEHDLLYVGGGQDREQALVAQDLVAKAAGVQESVAAGAAVLAVCGGYQLLGRSYRDLHGSELPGIGVFPFDTVAGETRMIGDVLLECELE